MEINTYNLKKDNDEFKDLTENQLYAIADLCMDYYKKGIESAQEDAYSDNRDEIDDLKNEIDNLEDQVNEFSWANNELEDLVKQCYIDGNEDVKSNIRMFCREQGYDYKWSWIEDSEK